MLLRKIDVIYSSSLLESVSFHHGNIKFSDPSTDAVEAIHARPIKDSDDWFLSAEDLELEP